jgi:hypothetical protein
VLKAAEAHRGVFEFNSLLGWDIIQKRLPFRSHSISAITVCTRVGAEDVIKVELLSQRQDVRNQLTSIFT